MAAGEKKKMKYFYGNLDGLRRGLIYTTSQKRVAEIAGTSLYDVRRYWSDGQKPNNLDPKPHTLYTREGFIGQAEYWVEGRLKGD